MDVTLYRLTSTPRMIDVKVGSTLREVLQTPGSGEAIGSPGVSVWEAVNGNLAALGTVRVDGIPNAGPDTQVREGDVITITPSVKGG